MRVKTNDEKLLAACAKGQMRSAMSALAAGANPNAKHAKIVGFDEKCLSERSALYLAAASSPIEVVRALLDAGADVNGRSLQGLRPIQASVARPEIVALLLGRGANPNLADDGGGTALMGACRLGGGYVEVSAGKSSMGFVVTKLVAAPAVPQAADSVGMLLAAGADANAKDSSGRYCASYAMDGNNAQVLKALIDSGAQVNVKTGGVRDHPISLLEQACRYGKESCLRVLLGSGASVQEGYSKSALYYAIRGGNAGCVEEMLLAGAKLSPAKARKTMVFGLTNTQGNQEHIKEVMQMYESLLLAHELRVSLGKKTPKSKAKQSL